MKRIYATFVGRDGSMGFKQGQGYVLYIDPKDPNTIETKDGTVCTYSSVLKFTHNWDGVLDADSADKKAVIGFRELYIEK